MDEFSFIDSIKQPYYHQSGLIKGIGDDAAVFRQRSQDIVTAVDTFVDGVHFSRRTMLPYHIGYRALAANISDMAAMGATPSFYLVSITIPKTWESNELREIFEGMKLLAKKYQMDLIGGDTVSGGELVISITVIGYVNEKRARYRNLAKNGDTVFVTGTVGDSQAGFYIMMNEGEYIDKDYFINRHRMPNPRVGFAKAISHFKRISLNDVSDGIASEAMEIAKESNVSIVLNNHDIPTSKHFNQFPDELKYEWKYFGGEDFELLGTVPNEDWPAVKRVADQVKVPVTKIGYVTEKQDKGFVFINKNGHVHPLNKRGYTHLK